MLAARLFQLSEPIANIRVRNIIDARNRNRLIGQFVFIFQSENSANALVIRDSSS